MSAPRWIALHCGDDTLTLIAKHPNAFLLLTQIAMRAKWKDCPITKLKAGQAHIGDWREAGLSTEKVYRHAKRVLSKCNLAEFKGASKGTVATLTGPTIFSITIEAKGGQTDNGKANQGRAGGDQGATNHTDTLNTPIPSLVTDSAFVGIGHSPPPTKADFPGPMMTLDEAKQCARKIWLEEIALDPYGNFKICQVEDLNGLATDWYVKAEQSGWIIDDQPMRNAEKALHGYLRKATNRKSKKYKELSNNELSDVESPF